MTDASKLEALSDDDLNAILKSTLDADDGHAGYMRRLEQAVAARYEARIAELERERDALRADAQDWMLIEEDAAVDAPLDTTVLLAWQDGGEWRIESGWVGSDRGGWRHGRATHWKPLPEPPAARVAQEKPE